MRALFGFGEDNKYNILRVWKDLIVLKHKVNAIVVGVCGTNRGRAGFNGCGIVYVSAATDRLMFTDVPKGELHQTIDSLNSNGTVKSNCRDEEVLALFQKWLADFKTVKTHVEILVGDTPQFTSVEALPPPPTAIAAAEFHAVPLADKLPPPNVEPIPAVNTNSKKRNHSGDGNGEQPNSKRPVGRPPKLSDFITK